MICSAETEVRGQTSEVPDHKCRLGARLPSSPKLRHHITATTSGAEESSRRFGPSSPERLAVTSCPFTEKEFPRAACVASRLMRLPFQARVRTTCRHFAHARLDRLLFFSGAMFAGITVAAESDMPANIDDGLQQLLREKQQSQSTTPQSAAKGSPSPSARFGRGGFAVRDSEQRVRIDIFLDGKVPMPTVRRAILAANGRVTAETEAYRNGVLTAYLPLEQVAPLAKSPGILSIRLSRRPMRNGGRTTSAGLRR
jgi:hypothetical protein